MPNVIRRVLLGIAVVLLQWLIFGRLQLWGAYPDVVLIFLAATAIRTGRLGGAAVGFVLGTAMDFIYGTFGVHMFVKTLMGFVIGLFSVEERDSLKVSPVQALVYMLVIALLHNGLTVIFFALAHGTRNTFLITVLWIGSAVYTALVAAVLSLFRPGR